MDGWIVGGDFGSSPSCRRDYPCKLRRLFVHRIVHSSVGSFLVYTCVIVCMNVCVCVCVVSATATIFMVHFV
jgi:hypothetical protein